VITDTAVASSQKPLMDELKVVRDQIRAMVRARSCRARRDDRPERSAGRGSGVVSVPAWSSRVDGTASGVVVAVREELGLPSSSSKEIRTSRPIGLFVDALSAPSVDDSASGSLRC
jgi:hypothetical protein